MRLSLKIPNQNLSYILLLEDKEPQVVVLEPNHQEQAGQGGSTTKKTPNRELGITSNLEWCEISFIAIGFPLE